MGAAAVANGADCLVLDVEGQYEGKYPQALVLHVVAALDGRRGLPGRARQLPVRRLSPGAAVFGLPRSGRRAVQRPAALLEGHRHHRRYQGYIHTWVWNRIYGRPIAPLGQVYNKPKAGQIRRFRALAMSHGFDGVSWWSWQSAGKRQWKAVGSPGLAGGGRSLPELSVPAPRLEGGLRRLGAAAARWRRVLGPDQRLLPGPRRRPPSTPSRRTTDCPRPATSTCRPGACWCRTSRSP